MTVTMRTLACASTRMLACASTLALAVPAAAQVAGSEEYVEDLAAERAMTWQDVTRPTIRFIQRDSEGNVVFDSTGMDTAPGASDPGMAEAIERADGATTGATDAASGEMSGDGNSGMMAQVDDSAAPATDGVYGEMAGQGDASADRTPMRAGGREAGPSDAMEAARDMPDSGDGMMAELDDRAAPATDGQYGERMTTSSGVQFDMQSFAREMFEQGYRRGYVEGMTEMRDRAMRQMRQDRARFQDRSRFREQAREQRRAMDEVLDRQPAQQQGRQQAGQQQDRQQNRQPQARQPQVEQQGDGTTIIMLPPGMTPQQFMQMLSAQR